MFVTTGRIYLATSKRPPLLKILRTKCVNNPPPCVQSSLAKLSQKSSGMQNHKTARFLRELYPIPITKTTTIVSAINNIDEFQH